MKRFYFLMFVLSLIAAINAQTRILAHKSHSGSRSDFSISGDETYGLPSKDIDTIIKISKDTIVEISNFFYHQRDTMAINEHPYFKKKIGIDSLRKLYPHITFLGFDKRIKGQKNQDKQNRLWPLLPESFQAPGLRRLIILITSFALLFSLYLFRQNRKVRVGLNNN